MVRVTFEIIPNGDESKKIRAATLEVKNEHVDMESGLASYTYSLWDGRGRREGELDKWPRNERTVVQLAYECLHRSGIGTEIGLTEMRVVMGVDPASEEGDISVEIDDAGEPI